MHSDQTQIKRPTRNDVAALAKVSGCTVSYVLNGREDVGIAADTRDRVLAAAKQLGYRPNHAARTLAMGSSQVVALWAGSFTPFYAMVANHLRDQVKASGFQILVSDIEMGSGANTPDLWPADGIIAIEYPEYADAYLQTHPDLRTPLVSIGTFHLEQGDYVGVDLYRGVREAMRHLFSIGCKRIAYIHTGGPNSENDPRSVAYVDAILEAGLIVEHVVLPGVARSDARSEIGAYIAKHGCPDGLLCHNDDAAVGVYRGLCDLGIKVPDEVALVGCDGIEDIEYLECPITTIAQPVDEMCRLGWEFLQRRMAEPATPPQRHVFQAELVIRRSTAKPGAVL